MILPGTVLKISNYIGKLFKKIEKITWFVVFRRKFEAKMMKIGYDPSVPLLLPQPISKDFEVFGHCTNECTTKIVDKRKPWRVFGVSFDTGPYGKSCVSSLIINE